MNPLPDSKYNNSYNKYKAAIDASIHISRRGVKWSDPEEAILLRLIEENLSLAEISKLHGRSIRSIKNRLIIIARTMIANGSTLITAMSITGLTSTEIEPTNKRKRSYTESDSMNERKPRLELPFVPSLPLPPMTQESDEIMKE